jgi:hypothetical protein
MNSLIVPLVTSIDYNTPVDVLTDLFNHPKAHKLTYEPWSVDNDKPWVEFKIIYSDDALFLKFEVKEKYFKAIYTQTNEPVWKDSCVEFFISLDDDGTYYNFEFNALGTKLAAFGTSNNRHQLANKVVDTVKCRTTYLDVPDSTLSHNWELITIIPLNILFKSRAKQLREATCTGNFYKCGDDLPEPHFLCWNNISAESPNFHLPEYFGQLIFE